MHFLQQRYEGLSDLRTAVFLCLSPERLLVQILFPPTRSIWSFFPFSSWRHRERSALNLFVKGGAG